MLTDQDVQIVVAQIQAAMRPTDERAEELGDVRQDVEKSTTSARCKVASISPHPENRPGVMFDGREGTDEDFAAILRTHNLPMEAEAGLVLAHSFRVLHFAEVGGFASWLVSDESRKVAEAHRLDGSPFPPVGSLGQRKAHPLKGSVMSWPVGLLPRLSADRHRRVPVVLVEGGPDLLAAFALLACLPMAERDFLPVAMLGTGASIGPDAIELLSRREVVIVAHGDKAGADAAARWASQLTKAACTVRVRELPAGLDLNAALSIHGSKVASQILKS